MEIYVQSCGVSQEHDYRWLKIPQEGQPHPEIPRILREASRIENGTKVRITDLYESQEPSIVVARDNGELLLLITALEAIERTKIYGRQVRNSVAWVIHDFEENKQVLSKIAAHATQNWEDLRKVIDEAVDFDDLDGFRVNRESLEQYVEYVNKQVNYSTVSSLEPKIEVVFWGMEDTKKNTNNPLFIAFILLIILILTIVVTIQILTGTYLQDPPPYQSPSPSLTQ